MTQGGGLVSNSYQFSANDNHLIMVTAQSQKGWIRAVNIIIIIHGKLYMQ